MIDVAAHDVPSGVFFLAGIDGQVFGSGRAGAIGGSPRDVGHVPVLTNVAIDFTEDLVRTFAPRREHDHARRLAHISERAIVVAAVVVLGVPMFTVVLR